MIYASQKALLLVGAGVALAFLTAPSSFWWLGFAGMAFSSALLVLDLFLVLPMRHQLELDVDLPEWLYVGSVEQMVLRFSPVQANWKIRLQVVCNLSENLRAVEPMDCQLATEEIELKCPLEPKRRGSAHIVDVRCRWRSPLGLLDVISRHDLGREITIIPNVKAVRSAALQFLAHDAYWGQKVQRRIGDGSEFESLREYLPGMDIRMVDWKHSARHRKLVSKDFRTERNHNIIMVFDTGRLMVQSVGAIPKLDHSINAGLLLAYVCLECGDRVGLFGFDEEVRLHRRPLAGKRNFHILQADTSSLDYHFTETNYTLGLTRLGEQLKRRSLIIVFTSFTDTVLAELLVENISRLVKRHLIVMVTLHEPKLRSLADQRPSNIEHVANAVTAGRLLQDQALVHQKLSRLGVHCLACDVGRLSSDLVDRYLRIKRLDLI